MIKVEIWSDINCPFCYMGKRNMETALQQFPHRDAVEITWRSFELDPYAESDRRCGRSGGRFVYKARGKIWQKPAVGRGKQQECD